MGAYKAWPVVLAIISTAWATYGWMQMRFEARVTDICQPVVDSAVTASRDALQETFDRRLQANFDHQQRLEIRLKQSTDDLQRLYWLYVGDWAAAQQRNGRHRELAAARARIALDEQLKKGKTLQDALSAVLAKPP